jgi:endonuclease G, mitochondrial
MAEGSGILQQSLLADPAPRSFQGLFSTHVYCSEVQISSRGSNPYEQTQIGAHYYDEAGDARARADYYAAVQDTFAAAPAELFHNLSQLTRTTHKPPSDLPGDALFGRVDRRPDGALYYLYSGEGPKNEAQVSERNGRDLQNYNLEHVVPKSWFDAQLPMRDDLHHLFTEERKTNSDRGDLPLREVHGEVQELKYGKLQMSHGKAFEPNGGKGEAARAILYFVTRYPGLVGDQKGELTAADLPTLLEWHHAFPVTDFERHRNAQIQGEQGTRNPYIDFPELAEAADLRLGFGPISNPAP